MVWRDNFWREMEQMRRRMDDLFGGFMTEGGRNRDEMIDELSTGYRKAFTNYKETDNEFVIQVELPGIDKEDIKLNITDSGLEIKAEKKGEREKGSKDGGEYSYTKSYAGFYQAFDVPENADLSKIDASHKNGVLTIKLPKKSVPEKKKIIPIK